MILETLLSSSAVARGFSGYLATLIGKKPEDFLVSPLELDFLAAGLILGLTAILSRGTKQSSVFNIVVCSINLSCIAFILIAGLPQAEPSNLEPFFPYGARGTFAAASIVFFAFVGFDYIANAAEEATDPRRGLPIGIIASLGIATLLYVLMAATLVMLVPAADVDVHAPFSAAFAARGVGWAAKIVSCGALAGIITSTMTGLLSQARLFVVLGRERLLPAALAKVHPTTNCPLVATLVTGGCAAILALLLDINILAELVSVGTLYVFYAVCAGTYFWRCHLPGTTRPQPALAGLGALTVSSICLSISFTYRAPVVLLIIFALAWICAAAMMCTLRSQRSPSRFAVPFFPATSILGILFTIHLVCSLGWPAYVRFVVWMVLGAAVYALYGAKAAEAHEMEIKIGTHQMQQQQREQDVELVGRTLSSLDHEGPIGIVQEEDRRWLLSGDAVASSADP
jgi:APA family basic amino acid/polyamine antiporter